MEVGATAQQEKGRSCDTGILSTQPQHAWHMTEQAQQHFSVSFSCKPLKTCGTPRLRAADYLLQNTLDLSALLSRTDHRSSLAKQSGLHFVHATFNSPSEQSNGFTR